MSSGVDTKDLSKTSTSKKISAFQVIDQQNRLRKQGEDAEPAPIRPSPVISNCARMADIADVMVAEMRAMEASQRDGDETV